MPQGFTATKLFVFVDGLSTTTAFVGAHGVDDRAVNSVASGTSLTISRNTTVSDPGVTASASVHGILALGAEKHALLARITEELHATEVLLALVADEAIEVVMLSADNLVKKSAALLLANRADHIFRLAGTAGGHHLISCCRLRPSRRGRRARARGSSRRNFSSRSSGRSC